MFYTPFVSCIIGGEETDRFRFTVSLRNKQNIHICGGALFTYRHVSIFVLTAASCVKNRQPQDLVVVGGITNLDDHNGKEFKIDKIISKNATGENEVRDNIALLRLTEAVLQSSVMYSITLAEDDEDEYVAKQGKECVVVGWGQKDVSAIRPCIFRPVNF